MTVAFPTIFSNIWSRSTIVGQGCPDVNNSDTNYDDADSNSPSYNCKVLVTEWDQWLISGANWWCDLLDDCGFLVIITCHMTNGTQQQLLKWVYLWLSCTKCRLQLMIYDCPISDHLEAVYPLAASGWCFRLKTRTLTAYPSPCRTTKKAFEIYMMRALFWVFLFIAVGADDR